MSGPGDEEEADAIINVFVHVRDKTIPVCTGTGQQRIKWLGNVGIARWDEKDFQGWKELGLPTAVHRQDSRESSTPLDMGAVIRDVLADGSHVIVEHSLEPTGAV